RRRPARRGALRASLRHPAGRRLGGTGRRTLERHEGGDEPQRPRADGRLGARAGRRGRLTPAPPIPECALVSPPPFTGEGWGGGGPPGPCAPGAGPPGPPPPRAGGRGGVRAGPPPAGAGEGGGGGKRVALAPSAPAARPPIPTFPRKRGKGRVRSEGWVRVPA